jgi:imidazolonepropionase-like amidohydrolase
MQHAARAGLASVWFLLAAILPLALVAPVAPAQDLAPKPAPQGAPVTIVNARLHPVSALVIERGFIRFDKGVITAIGAGEPPAGAADGQTLDAAGQSVYPGLITPFSQLGLTEIGAVRATRDFDETGAITPEALPLVAVNPDSTFLPVTRATGVLLAGVFPTGGLIPGRVSAITLDGWTYEEMTARRDCGLFVQWPMMRVVRAWWMEKPEDEQRKDIAENLRRVRETFRTARAYADRRRADPALPVDARWEAMRAIFPAADGAGAQSAPQQPVFIQASELDAIMAALDLCQELGLKMVLVGGHDAHLCAPELARRRVPVIFTGVLDLPRRDDDPYDVHFALPARLIGAGVQVAIASGEETPHERNLPFVAGMAAAHGLSVDQALRAITLTPAQVLGIDARYGSLEVGKSATLFMATGPALEVRTRVTGAFIDGRQISLRSKQDDLADKYREKYRQQPEAPAPEPAR